MANLLGMISAGYRMALLPEVLMRARVPARQIRRLEAAVPLFQLNLVWLRQSTSPVLRDFLAVVQELARDPDNLPWSPDAEPAVSLSSFSRWPARCRLSGCCGPGKRSGLCADRGPLNAACASCFRCGVRTAKIEENELQMRRDTLLQNLLGAGLDSALAVKALDAGFNLSSLRSAKKGVLKKSFDRWETDCIQQQLQRNPIADEVVLQLVEACDWACCLCWDLDKRWPIIIHHIEEHAKGGDDSYENLVVLCLNHHGVAHSKWEISRPPAPPEYIRNRKKDMEKAVADFKSGNRAAPGREGTGVDPHSQSDVAALKIIARFLARPAMYRPFHLEGNMADFLAAMTDVIRALTAGVLMTREGEKLGLVKSVREFSNPEWRERLELVSREFDTLRARVEFSIRQGELRIQPDGYYSFNNPDLPVEIDAGRSSIVSMLNPILQQADVPLLKGPEPPAWARSHGARIGEPA